MENNTLTNEPSLRKRVASVPPESAEPPRSLYTNIDTSGNHSGVTSGLDSHAVDESRMLSVQNMAAPFTDDTSTTDTICERCRSLLRICPLLDFQDDFLNGHFADIRAEFLCVGCSICSQLRVVFEYCHMPDLLKLYQVRLMERDALWTRYPTFFVAADNFPSMRFSATQSIHDGFSPSVIRKVCPDVPDYQFIRTRLETCAKEHSRCSVRSQPIHQPLKVIDCNSRRLVVITPDHSYICLSYVWGSNAIQETGVSGDELPSILPKTVEDAMVVAINLGIPFLWVDRYCIDQNNSEEKHDIIRHMDKIYEGGEVTIIAALGDDPHYGLPGVQGMPREPRISLNLDGTVFLALEEDSNQVHRSKWAKRGWTYQEMLLSRRRLVFTSTQMYLQCRTRCYIEGVDLDDRLVRISESLHYDFGGVLPFKNLVFTADSLDNCLVNYYSKHLSFDADIINAFTGILDAFDSSQSFPYRVKQLYGVIVLFQEGKEHVARECFLQSLCWSIDDVPLPIAEALKTADLFPSWSWASARANHVEGRLRHWRFSVPKFSFPQNDAEICVTHKRDGNMNIPEFVRHQDNYDMFFPSIELTSWSLQIPHRTVSHPDMGCIFHENLFEILPQEPCLSTHVAFLKLSNEGSVTKTDNTCTELLSLRGLVLQEVEHGIFLRLGPWMWEDVTPRNSSYEMLSEVLEEEKVKKQMFMSQEQKLYRKEMKWEWRKMRIV